MIYHKSKQVGFIEHGEANIDKIMHNGECVFTQGFDSEASGTDSVTLEGTIGKDLMDWSIVGNTYQASQPSPSSPVSVFGVGDRTGNLFEGEIKSSNISGLGEIVYPISAFTCYYAKVKKDHTYIVSSINTTTSFDYVIGYFDKLPKIGDKSVDGKRIITTNKVITSAFDGYIVIRFPADSTNVMLNEGLTPLPYEPYGVKIHMTCYNADHTKEITTPIYLPTPLMANERLTPTSREVKWGKYVFTGNETFGFNPNYNMFTITTNEINVALWTTPLCSHFASTGDVRISPTNNTKMVWITDSIDKWNRSINDFKSFIKSEYDKGTPVTVWYQLANPTTEPVETIPIGTLRNEEKTIKGTTTIITTDTEVLPTQIEASYKSNKADYAVVNFATVDGNIFTTANGDTYTIKMRKSQYDTMMTNELLNLLEVM